MPYRFLIVNRSGKRRSYSPSAGFLIRASPRNPFMLLVACGLLVLQLTGASVAPGQSVPKAHAARTVKTIDTAHLHLVKESGSDLLEEGSATGTLPGTVKVSLNVGATIYATFTITTRNGAITGHGSGTLHSSNQYASFGGSLTATGGTGRYAHAHGTGGLYGVINRRTYALTIQTTGKLTY